MASETMATFARRACAAIPAGSWHSQAVCALVAHMAKPLAERRQSPPTSAVKGPSSSRPGHTLPIVSNRNTCSIRSRPAPVASGIQAPLHALVARPSQPLSQTRWWQHTVWAADSDPDGAASCAASPGVSLAAVQALQSPHARHRRLLPHPTRAGSRRPGAGRGALLTLLQDGPCRLQ